MVRKAVRAARSASTPIQAHICGMPSSGTRIRDGHHAIRVQGRVQRLFPLFKRRLFGVRQLPAQHGQHPFRFGGGRCRNQNPYGFVIDRVWRHRHIPGTTGQKTAQQQNGDRMEDTRETGAALSRARGLRKRSPYRIMNARLFHVGAALARALIMITSTIRITMRPIH